jgi:hypothetical protein
MQMLGAKGDIERPPAGETASVERAAAPPPEPAAETPDTGITDEDVPF